MNPERTVSANATGTIKNIWQYFKEIKASATVDDFDKAWLGIWAGSYADYLSLCRYGWSPIACKLSNGKGTNVAKHAMDWPKNAAGQDLADDWFWGNVFTPSLPAPQPYYGTTITSDGSNGTVYINTYPEKYYAYPPVEMLDTSDAGTATPDAWWRLIAPFDPVDLAPYDGATVLSPYVTSPFKKGDGVNAERYREPPGLPTLEMRRYYRRMALQLWMKTLDPSSDAAASHNPWQPGDDSNAFEKEVPASKNPLITLIPPKMDINSPTIISTGDLCAGENWRYPHPARIYALTFLAHAAMLVTGSRGPLIETKGGAGYGRYVPDGSTSLQDKPPGMYDVFPSDVWGLGASTAAWLLCDMNQDHPGLTNSASSSVFDDPGAALASTNRKYYDGFQLLKEDIEFARMAHENCMRWITVYSSENPNDLCCPRPANRQSFMDRPLWAFDLFPGNAANRGTVPFNYYNYREEYYRLYSDRPTIFSPIYSGKQSYGYYDPPNHGTPQPPSWDGFHRLINPKWVSAYNTHNQPGAQGSYHRTSDSAQNSGKPWLLNPADDPGGFHFNKAFDASERCRELVFWSADWLNYEDAESAPSAPFDATWMYQYDNGTNFGTGGNAYGSGILMYNMPEWPFIWMTPERISNRGARGDNTTAGLDLKFFDVLAAKNAGESWLYGFGQHGADRNGNGRYDRGTIPASRRLRAETLSRYMIYDPVGPCGVRR